MSSVSKYRKYLRGPLCFFVLFLILGISNHCVLELLLNDTSGGVATESHCSHGDSKESSESSQSHSHGEPCSVGFYAAVKPVTEQVSVSHSIVEFFSLIAFLETNLLAPDYSLLAGSSPDPWEPYVSKILSSLTLSPNAPPATV